MTTLSFTLAAYIACIYSVRHTKTRERTLWGGSLGILDCSTALLNPDNKTSDQPLLLTSALPMISTSRRTRKHSRMREETRPDAATADGEELYNTT